MTSAQFKTHMLVSALLASLGFGANAALAATEDTEAAHMAAANAASGQDLKSQMQLCRTRPPGPGPRPAVNRTEPRKVFDNLYYVGILSVSSWAVTTSAGIILIDTLNTPEEAQDSIEGGLKKIGLDPAQIKYIVVTHAHPDHYGGAQYLADKYHAQVVMSETDWNVLANPQAIGRRDTGEIPKRGMAVKDGDKLTLGDTTIEFVETPPHTPGAISLIIPLKDGNTRHAGGLWGGIGFNFRPTEANYTTYANSVAKFAKIAETRGVDVPMANHPDFQDDLVKLEKLDARKAGEPNPFVLGWPAQARIFTIQSECALAMRARVRAGAAK
jgi:metallo-beta-lactamase class B